ncbi:amidohydrolase family protein [Symbioplanes lichenis]|uniref:amidohydrolase family protein n=1 Tax=Symbioplanes lichenis TaxID=1629072 RepID=UPI0027399F2C|nr:amidohydrolase [Actinoplanes lichenis]
MTWLLPDTLWHDGALRTGLAWRAGVVSLSSSGQRLSGTLLPGLVDAHAHTQLIDVTALRGLSGVWDLGGNPAVVAGQALRWAGPFLIAPGGYPSDRSWAPAGSCREVLSVTDAEAAVAEVAAAGATLVKVTAHAGGPVLPAATLAALVDAAHTLRLPVVVHAEGPGTVAAAYEAGADLLAHTPWTSSLDDGLVRACAGRMTWISTLDIHGYGEETPARGTAIGNLRRFAEYGGTVRYGTDLGNGPLPPGINAREIRALLAAGLTPADVVAAMTDNDWAAPAWVPAGLDLDPGRFPESLAAAGPIVGT